MEMWGFVVFGKLQSICSKTYPPELANMETLRRNKRHSNLQLLVSVRFGNWRIHRTTDRNLLAWSQSLNARILDKLSLIEV